MNTAPSVLKIKPESLFLHVSDFTEKPLQVKPEENPVFDKIKTDGGEIMLQYVRWLGLAETKDVMILSSLNHFYYDTIDLSDIGTLINLIILNHIKHLESFLSILPGLLTKYSGFIGYFRDDEAHENQCHLGYLRMPRPAKQKIMVCPVTDKYLTRQYVIQLLQKNGFRIKDLTIIGNIVFFYSEVLNKTQ